MKGESELFCEASYWQGFRSGFACVLFKCQEALVAWTPRAASKGSGTKISSCNHTIFEHQLCYLFTKTYDVTIHSNCLVENILMNGKFITRFNWK